MSRVLIQSLRSHNYWGESLVMSWEEYQSFCLKAPGEGVTWKAYLVN